MLKFIRNYHGDIQPMSTLTLSFDERARSRQRVELDNGTQAGLFLSRGTILQHDDLLQAESTEVVKIVAAQETVSTAKISDLLLLARCSYHLGNRHVPLQITAEFIRYQHDHVLDEMLKGLGIVVTVEQAPFEPEAGAYGGQGDSHSHHHSHEGDEHNHAH